MKVYLDVRCCCDPGLLLGWLPVDREAQRYGAMIGFALFDAFLLPPPGVEFIRDNPPKRVALTVATFNDRTDPFEQREYLALKSNDTPIEELRKIPYFVENTSGR